MRKLILVFVLLLLLSGCSENRKVTVCIIDSGCNNESALGYNYLDDNDDISDNVGHGTEMHSLFCQLNQQSEIYCLKCFDNNRDCNVPEIAEAIQDAVDSYHADVILMSFVSDQENQQLHQALEYAAGSDVILVAATGNLDLSVSTRATNYPAGYDCVIGVGAVDLDENGNPKSSLWYHKGQEVYVVANGQYQDKKGTSYAAARIAALTAELIWENPKADSQKIKTLLKEKAIDLGEEGYDTTFGYGYLDY